MWQQTQVQFNRSLWKNDHTFGFTARLSFLCLSYSTMLISEKYSFNHFDKKSENKTGYDHIQVRTSLWAQIPRFLLVSHYLQIKILVS